MNHYEKELVVLLVLSAMSISGVCATTVGVMTTNNGGINSESTTVNSGSAINQGIASHSVALTGTNQITGNYFFSDSLSNQEGDRASITVSVTDISGNTAKGSHSYTSSVSPTVITYASALTVGSPNNNNGANSIENTAYGLNAAGDYAQADMGAMDNADANRANMQNSFVMGGATKNVAFAWGQADNIQGDWVYETTYSWDFPQVLSITNPIPAPMTDPYLLCSGNLEDHKGTEAAMWAGDSTGTTAWQISPYIVGYQGYSVMACCQAVSVLNSGTVDATNTADTFCGITPPNANVLTMATSMISGASWDNVYLLSGKLSVAPSSTSFGYYNNAFTYSQLAATSSEGSSAEAYAQTGANSIPASNYGSGCGNTDFDLQAYSGIEDNSANAIVNTV